MSPEIHTSSSAAPAVHPGAALPFILRREHDVVSGSEVTSTREEAHGLLRIDADHLVIQWRTTRETSRVGREIRTDREMDPIREAAIPLNGLAGARVRRRWLAFPPRWEIVLTASDLRAFDALAGEAGLILAHPAEVTLRLRGSDRVAAEEFAGELELTLAERSLRGMEQRARLDRPRDVSVSSTDRSASATRAGAEARLARPEKPGP